MILKYLNNWALKDVHNASKVFKKIKDVSMCNVGIAMHIFAGTVLLILKLPKNVMII
jgi:hypothetical protein